MATGSRTLRREEIYLQVIETHRHVFTDYVRLLDTADEEPTRQLVEEVMLSLWRVLRSELKKRGLWNCPPSYLGVYGLESWDQAMAGGAGRLNVGLGEGWELMADCFRYVFIDRYRYIVRQLEVKPDIDGLIVRNVRNFLHDTQRKHDALGFRVFVLLQTAVLEMVEASELTVLKGDPRIRNSTTLGFKRKAGVTASDAAQWRHLVGAWSDDLLPDLITARGQDQKRVVAALRRLFLALPSEGVREFRFGDLLEPLKDDVRARWSALFEISEGETGITGGDAALLSVVRKNGPDTRFEERDAFHKLADCVEKSMQGLLDESPAVKRYLSKLWHALKIYAAGPEQRPGPHDHQASSLSDDKLPSHRKLAEMLEIPRKRLSELFAILGKLVGSCRQAAPALAAAGSTMENQMDDRSRALESLRQGMAEARRQASSQAAELRTQARRPPGPGDLYLLDRTSESSTVESSLEWAVLEQDPQDPNRFLVVPADTNLLSGSTDVSVPKEALGGPLSLRCDHGVWLDASELDPSRRTGALESTFLHQAQGKRQQLEAGTLIGSEPEQEVDADPEYRRWRKEILKPARALAERPSRGGEAVPFASPEPSAWSPGIYRIAASILLATTLGMGGGLIWQQQRVRSADHKLIDLEQRLSGAQQEQQRLQESHTELQRDKKRADEEHQQQIAELESRIASPTGFEVQVNPPMVVFRDDEVVRATAKRIEISPDAVMFSLIINVEDMAGRYRLQILRRETRERIWIRDSLEPNQLSELALLVPTSLVTPGDYRFRLERLEEGRAELVGEYGLTIEPAP